MTNFFRGSTHQSGLQQAIERATDGSQSTEDWALIMKICDHVGTHEESAKETMKIIRKRLQTNPVTSGWRPIGLTLSLLEALTKNCGKIFHLQIAHKDFLKELKNVIGPKNNPPLVIQERVLGMIQTWALAFHHDPDLKTVEHFYQECKQQGLLFPSADPENIIKTAVPSTGTIQHSSQYARPLSQPTPGTISRQNRSAYDEPVGNNQTGAQSMSAEHVAKLRSELDIVQTNAQVFGEMLVTLQPGEENPQDFELLMELHETCKQMQARVMDLLPQMSIDDITVDLLRYNDEFNNSFKTFESYMQERDRRLGSSHMPRLNQTASSPSRTFPQSNTKNPLPSTNNADNEPALIRFDDEPTTLATNYQNMRINPTSSDAIPKNTQQQSTASATTRSVPTTQDPERDVKEIEQWLKFQGDDSDDEQPRQESAGTTAAFNNFLQKRASTIPDEPVSEQNIYLNLQQPPTRNPQSSTHMY